MLETTCGAAAGNFITAPCTPTPPPEGATSPANADPPHNAQCTLCQTLDHAQTPRNHPAFTF
eukprot:9492390-Pyramimonas_sp.AAC.1